MPASISAQTVLGARRPRADCGECLEAQFDAAQVAVIDEVLPVGEVIVDVALRQTQVRRYLLHPKRAGRRWLSTAEAPRTFSSRRSLARPGTTQRSAVLCCRSWR